MTYNYYSDGKNTYVPFLCINEKGSFHKKNPILKIKNGNRRKIVATKSSKWGKESRMKIISHPLFPISNATSTKRKYCMEKYRIQNSLF